MGSYCQCGEKMVNQKILISYLTLLLIMILYIINQVLFLNMLTEPQTTEYAWIDDSFKGFLIEDTYEYIAAAKRLDASVDNCTIFIDENTNNATYTNECNLENKTYISESQPFQDKTFIEYNSMYEYLYGLKLLKPIDNLMDIDFPRYNLILFNNDGENIQPQLSNEYKIKEMNTLYTQYEDNYKFDVLIVQVKILVTLSSIMLLLFIFGYVSLKRREMRVFKILGLNSMRLASKIFLDLFVIITTAYVAAISIFSLIIWLNGKLFFLSMYFEYMNISISGLLYIVLITVNMIIGCMYYIQLRLTYD